MDPKSVPGGGPAFPLEHNAVRNGMSLRDYFAAKALTGLLAAAVGDDYEEQTLLRKDYSAYCLLTAESAYDMADAMLVAREA